jgi:hypothetical protein
VGHGGQVTGGERARDLGGTGLHDEHLRAPVRLT